MNIAFAQGFPVDLSDRGLSEEAQQVRRIRYEYQSPDNSFYSIDKRNQILTGLRNAFMHAANDNWDGYQAFRADTNSLPYAIEFLNLLPLSFPFPDIAVDKYGEIAIEWDYGPRRVISIRVGKDGTLRFASLLGYSSVHGAEILQDKIPQTIQLWIDSVIRNESA